MGRYAVSKSWAFLITFASLRKTLLRLVVAYMLLGYSVKRFVLLYMY